MAVPAFHELMLPVLKQFSDGSDRRLGQQTAPIAQSLQLTEADISERLPSGKQTRFRNRLAWAHNYLKQSGLLESPARGIYRLTQRGRDVLAAPPPRIDIPFLEQYPEFLDFKARSGEEPVAQGAATIATETQATELTPDEQIRAGYARLRANLAAALLERVKQAPPAFFENLVVEVLVAMGYGGSHEDAAQVVGQVGDGGIDGIIKQDRLGLESIYVQAKRWEGNVGGPVVQQFAGALQLRRARKGVLITTSGFTRDALEHVANLQNTIVLVDGKQLTELMIDYGVGVSEGETLRLKKLDEDYFSEGLD